MTTDPRDLLARVAWGEARGDGIGGMTAVINVVMNRAARPRWWGRDVASVCLKPYQFSCLNADDPNRPKLLAVGAEDRAFADALMLADRALAGRLPDITNGADHYHVTRMSGPPVWAKGRTRVAEVGGHSFFRLEP